MYYKVIKDEISFNEAIEAFKNNHIIVDTIYNSVYDPAITDLKNATFNLNQIQSNKWQIVADDEEMNKKLSEVRDMMHEMNLVIDNRFYNEGKMDINDYWNLFNDQFIKDELAYNIMRWYYFNKYDKTAYKKH